MTKYVAAKTAKKSQGDTFCRTLYTVNTPTEPRGWPCASRKPEPHDKRLRMKYRVTQKRKPLCLIIIKSYFSI